MYIAVWRACFLCGIKTSLPLRKNVSVFQDAYLKLRQTKRRRTVGKRRVRNAVRTLDETEDGISGTFTNQANQTGKVRQLLSSGTQKKPNLYLFLYTDYKYTLQPLSLPSTCFMNITNQSCQQRLWLSLLLVKSRFFFSVFSCLLDWKSLQTDGFECEQSTTNTQKNNPTFTHQTIQRGQPTVVRGRSWDINQSMAGKQSRAFPPTECWLFNRLVALVA